MNKFANPTKHTVTLPDPAGTHQMVYYEWGNPQNPRVLVCLHGLTRNSRDFDFLAAALHNDYRILAPDLIGRGKSDWLKDPELYTIHQYVADMMGWMHQLGLKEVDWLGVSLGGIIGMLIAGLPHSPVQHLALVDIGPIVKRTSVVHLSSEVAENPVFKSLGELKDFLKKTYATTGTMESYHWDHLLAYDHITLPDGTFARAYDPELFRSFVPMQHEDIVFWPVFEALHLPMFVLHGEKSVVLTPDICAEMKRLQPSITFVDLPGITHAPSMMDEKHIGLVKQWLEQFVTEKQISG